MEKQIQRFQQLVNLIILIQINQKFAIFIKENEQFQKLLISPLGEAFSQFFIFSLPKEQNQELQIEGLLGQIKVDDNVLIQGFLIKIFKFFYCSIGKIFE